MSQPRLPLRLALNLSIQEVGPETLIYDEVRHQAFCLDRIASAVWKQCDGQHTIAQIAVAAAAELGSSLPEESVVIALARFDADKLLVAEPATSEVPFAVLANSSRRSLMAKMGASAVLMIPAVAMVMAPKAAQAYSGCFDCTLAKPGTGNQSGTGAPAPGQGNKSSSPSLFNDDVK